MLFCYYRAYEDLRVKHEPLQLITPQFETPLPPLQPAVSFFIIENLQQSSHRNACPWTTPVGLACNSGKNINCMKGKGRKYCNSSVMECLPIGQLAAIQFCIKLDRSSVRVLVLFQSMAHEDLNDLILKMNLVCQQSEIQYYF